jgi:pyruvate/2-oxoacid:ferredoxin oxidoreductase alpha subunit
MSEKGNFFNRGGKIMKVENLLGKKTLIDGNEAAALGVFLARAQVIAGYPITPSTKIIEILYQLCQEGKLRAEFIKVESEHSAMAALMGAASLGVRTFTATSSQGLALMHEMLHWASGARLPIVMTAVNRALGAPWNILSDMTDTLSQRDTGWIQFYCSSCQEILDTILQAYKIAEKFFLPAMVCFEGFTVSHRSEAVVVPTLEQARSFLPAFNQKTSLNLMYPFNFSGQNHIDYAKYKRSQQEAMKKFELLESFWTFLEFKKIFGRQYDLLETHQCSNDPKLILVAAGPATGTIRYVLEKNKITDVGLLRLRMLRPFPQQSIKNILCRTKKVAVVDKSLSPGEGGILTQEIKNALYELEERPIVYENIAGLGGEDITSQIIEQIIEDALSGNDQKKIFWRCGSASEN